MEYEKALIIAQRTLEQLRPHCFRAEIAGSVRRKKPEVKDIEIVIIPKPYEIGVIQHGLPDVVNQWKKIKGDLIPHKCRYTQRILPEGIKLDLFFATPENWGYIFAIRTGSAAYSHEVLGKNWRKRGYKGVNGYLTLDGKVVPVPEEEDLYRLIGRFWLEPEHRNVD